MVWGNSATVIEGIELFGSVLPNAIVATIENIKKSQSAVQEKYLTTELLLSRCFLVDELRKLLGQVGDLKFPEATKVGEGGVALA